MSKFAEEFLAKQYNNADITDHFYAELETLREKMINMEIAGDSKDFINAAADALTIKRIYYAGNYAQYMEIADIAKRKLEDLHLRKLITEGDALRDLIKEISTTRSQFLKDVREVAKLEAKPEFKIPERTFTPRREGKPQGQRHSRRDPYANWK